MRILNLLKKLKRMASVGAIPICMVSISLLCLSYAPLYGQGPSSRIPNMIGTWTVSVISCDFDNLDPNSTNMRCGESEETSHFEIDEQRNDAGVFAGDYWNGGDRHSYLTGAVMPDQTVGVQILTYYFDYGAWTSTERVVATGTLQRGTFTITGYAHTYQEDATSYDPSDPPERFNPPKRISTSYFTATKTGGVTP